MPLVMATFIGMVRNQVLRTVSGPIGGLITAKTRLKSPTKVIIVSLLLTTLGVMTILATPSQNAFMYVIIAVLLFLAFLNYVARGLYFATIGEVGTPNKTFGTTVGVASLIGFIPDVFVYPLIGSWQDHLPAEEAYRNMWLLGLGATVMGLIFALLLLRDIKGRSGIVQQTGKAG